jgi:hypothetical protein
MIINYNNYINSYQIIDGQNYLIYNNIGIVIGINIRGIPSYTKHNSDISYTKHNSDISYT